MRFASIQYSNMRLRPGLREPSGEAYSALPDPLADFNGEGRFAAGRERRKAGQGREEEGRRGAGRKGEGREG